MRLPLAMLATVFLLGAAPAGAPVRVLVLGDSLAAGYGLPPEEGFQALLAAGLQARGSPVKLEDGAVSGDTSAGGLARLDWLLGDDPAAAPGAAPGAAPVTSATPAPRAATGSGAVAVDGPATGTLCRAVTGAAGGSAVSSWSTGDRLLSRPRVPASNAGPRLRVERDPSYGPVSRSSATLHGGLVYFVHGTTRYAAE